MTDYTELNTKAQAAIAELSDLNQDWPTDGDYFDCQSGTEFEYLCAANPAVVLALIAEFEALRKDAERYRCIRDGDSGVGRIAAEEYGTGLDAAIDAEIQITMSKEAGE